ncbi:MAG: tRNA (N(6)-L-threonylcarbamoyladenosine(37)-C(2))-methylthiotransferase MtaB [Candidatus Omnitrophica bacterium]|nr:tRNA (N(6)-L-threonylcarbamoyladenosine(37)-C(2))-methylthiotransferase MtaB [Candidatus Omnitrophota bacterium]
MKTVKFFTLGCKVNQYETEQMRERFQEAGFLDVESLAKADNYVINTCTVTRSADRKSRYLINFARRKNPKARIIVTGCFAELDGKEINRMNGVAKVIKNRDKHRILRLMGVRPKKAGGLKTGISNFSGHARAFLKVQDGCNNRCSYCKVPLVRGRSRSRPLEEILKEAVRFTENGFQEIVLCGICLGSYGGDLRPRKGLVDIIEALENIPRLRRIRLSSIEESDVSEDLLQKMKRSAKLCPHLHIPLQSGDNQILKGMNRHYRSQDYLKLIRRIKALIPQIAITTDIMVGFPGEEEANFKNTLALVKEILPLKVHIFPYSMREGTAAADLKNQVNARVLRDRLLRLEKLSQDCALDYCQRFIGLKTQVLIEGPYKKQCSYWEGRTANYIKAAVKSEKGLRNKFIEVRLKKINGDCVLADFC